MQFELSEEQDELVGLLRTLLKQRADSAAVRQSMTSAEGFDRELWRVLCEEIGAASLAIPEEFGGAGFSSIETHLVLEELGYSLAPSPYLGSATIATQALLVSGDTDACERLLPEIAAGAHIAALGWADADGKWAPDRVAVMATPDDDSWLLHGEVPLVLDGAAADTLLTIAQTPDGPALFEVSGRADVDVIDTPAVDPTLRFATLRFDGVRSRALTLSPDLAAIRDHALAAVAAFQVGTAARGLDDTAAYSKQRVQFGRAIGSFQALKHRMADMHVQVETARTTARAAAWAASTGSPELPALAALAKAWCSDALELIASETVQLHGGIAITWEHDAQLIFKRAHATAQLFGTAADQRTRMAGSLGSVGT